MFQMRSLFLVSTTECLLSNLRSKEDLVEVRGKMIEAAGAIEVLVPQLQMYMNQDEPRDEDAKVICIFCLHYINPI